MPKRLFYYFNVVAYFLLSCSFIFPATQGYKLQVSKRKQDTCLIFSHNDKVLADVSVQHAFVGYKALKKTLCAKQVHIRLSKNRRKLELIRVDGPIKKAIHITLEGSIIFVHALNAQQGFELEAPEHTVVLTHDLTINGKLSITCHKIDQKGVITCGGGLFACSCINNYRPIVCYGNCVFNRMNKGGTFHNQSRIDVHGDLTLDFPSGRIANCGGALFAHGHVVVTADNFLNGQPILEHKNRACVHYYNYKPQNGWSDAYCKEYSKSEKQDTAYIVSRNGDVILNLSHGTNEAGVIEAAQTVKLSCISFDNKTHYLDDVYCKSFDNTVAGKKFPVWLPSNRGSYNPAVIVGGTSVDLTINGQKRVIGKGHRLTYDEHIPGLSNSGVIGTSSFALTAGKNASVLFNGIKDTHQLLPTISDQPKTLALYPPSGFEKKPYILTNGKHYVFGHKFESDKQTSVLHEHAFAAVMSPDSSGTFVQQLDDYQRLLYSPQLECDLIRDALYKHAHLPLLTGYHNASQQCSDLWSRGLWIALVNGSMHVLRREQKVNQIPELGQDEKQLFDEIIKKHAIGQPKIDAQQLYMRRMQIETGSHAVVSRNY